jgi:DNA repair protein RecO (recombination protein O)
MRLLARQDPHPQLYRLYRNSMQRLALESDVEPVLRIFEKRLLEELGYGLLLDHDVQHGEALEAAGYYDYHLESGPVRVADAQAPGFVFRGSSLLALADERLETAQARQDAKRLIRSALNLYLGNKPLKSRELFRVLKK